MENMAKTFVNLMQTMVKETQRTNELLSELIGEQQEMNTAIDDLVDDVAMVQQQTSELVAHSELRIEGGDFSNVLLIDILQAILGEEVQEANGKEEEEQCTFPYCSCQEDDQEEVELSFAELEDLALKTINELTSAKQLPYPFFGEVHYEYDPKYDKQISIGFNEEEGIVVASMMDTFGVVVREGQANCLPTDQFSPYIGAVIATCRLFKLEVPQVFVK